MPTPDFKRVEDLFHKAVALPNRERSAFLDQACAGNAELHAAVEDLLKHDNQATLHDDFLVSPVGPEAERLRSGRDNAFHDTGLHDMTTVQSELPHIPGYEVLDCLGRGGMGVVYKARQISLNRVVALKMLVAPGVATPEQLARFRAEAEILARLHLPNIIPIYDIGEHEGRPYFTMEYVDGPSLAQLLKDRPQNATASAALTEVVARTMHAVHQNGIIHRDLKPGNILLQEEEITTNHTNHTNTSEAEGDRSSIRVIRATNPQNLRWARRFLGR